MQHAQPVTSSFPWRAATLVVGAVAAIELVALIGIGAVRLAPHAKNPAGPVKPKARAVQARKVAPPVPSHPLRRRERVRVLVLNGNGVQGAAASEASRLEVYGYRIGGAQNATRHDYARSMVMYVPGWVKEARRLARESGIRLVAPIDGLRRAQLMGSKLVVILGT
jgi:LytR cell envelope-related transcriptional attenuator